MLHIDIWADFACPACYLAKPRIDEAIAASGQADAITVTYRSFELVPDAGPEPFDSFEHVLHKFGGDQARAARIEEHMDAVQRDLLGEGTNGYTAAYLADAAVRAGVPAARAKGLLAGDEYAGAVRADKKAAREVGVTAVPFTVLGGRLAIPGTASADAYADAIRPALSTRGPQ